MKWKSETMPEIKKVAVLSLDEIAIGSEWNYDKKKKILSTNPMIKLWFSC